MARFDHGHAEFADGREIEFGWTGWPGEIDPSKDTNETRTARRQKRLAYLEEYIREWAGDGYEDVPIVKMRFAG